MAPSPQSAAVGVRRFASADAERANEHLRHLYGLTPRSSFQFSDDHVDCTTSSLAIDGCQFTRIRYRPHLVADAPGGLDKPAFVAPNDDARLRYQTADVTLPVDRSNAAVLPARVAYDSEVWGCDTVVVQLDPDFIAADLGLPAVRFLPGTATGTEQQHWRSVVSLASRLVRTTPEASNDTLLRREMVRMLNTAALAVFPHVAPQDTGRGPATPPAVRRAIEFISSHPAEQITLADIAEAARVSPRCLQAGFRRHLGVTPLEYLRETRLDLAHRDLVRAADDGEVSVTEIAHRWGFTNPGRFARLHQERFGTMPRDVVRRARSA